MKMGMANLYLKSMQSLAWLVLLSYGVLAYADDVANTQEESTQIISTQNKTTVNGTAQDWGLTEAEWQDYVRLMQGADGLWYAHLSPPSVLGMQAERLEEQQHFAEIVAKQEHDKVARELAFNNAVWLAMRRLYPDEPMIKDFDKTPFNPIKNREKKATASLQAGDRLALFENITQGMDLAVLPKLLALLQANPKVSLDIYCMGATDDNAIRQWAMTHQVPSQWVQSGRITLNQDDGRLQKLTNNPKLPYLVLVRNGQSMPVSIWDL